LSGTRLAFAFANLLALASIALAQSNPDLPKLHAPAPPLRLEKVIGAPSGSTPDLPTLRGKVVVVEFWATWCAPCLGEIPAINALVKSLDPQKVQFLSVTDENPEKIEHFLAKKPISGWVGIDTSSSVFERYGVVSRPATIIIDPQGKVVSNSLSPDQLSRQQLLALAENRSHSLTAGGSSAIHAKVEAARDAAQKEEIGATGSEANAEALFSLSITPSKGGVARVMKGEDPGKLDLLNLSVEQLLEHGLGFNEARITVDPSISKQTYNLHLHAPGASQDQLRAALELAITSASKTRLEHPQTQEDVLLLQRFPGKPEPRPDGQSTMKLAFYDPEKAKLTAMSASSEQLASAAWEALGTPVFNDSSDTAACTGNIKIQKGDREALRLWLEQSCGLTLVPGNRVVERLKLVPLATAEKTAEKTPGPSVHP
jgi:thiol-disulfide isomerase/thioredoxin